MSATFRPLLPILGLVALLVMAGCTTGPFGNPAEQEGTVTLIINNSANETHNLDIRVVEPSASLTIHYRDGAVVKSEVGQGLSNHDTGPRTVTKIDFPESARVQGQYTLEPDEENKSSIKNAFSDSVLVVVVSNSDGEIFSWVSANCDEQDLVGLEVTSYPTPPGGVFASYECR